MTGFKIFTNIALALIATIGGIAALAFSADTTGKLLGQAGITVAAFLWVNSIQVVIANVESSPKTEDEEEHSHFVHTVFRTIMTLVTAVVLIVLAAQMPAASLPNTLVTAAAFPFLIFFVIHAVKLFYHTHHVVKLHAKVAEITAPVIIDSPIYETTLSDSLDEVIRAFEQEQLEGNSDVK